MVTGAEALVVVLVGFFAGVINTIVGSGSLVTFPTLVALGLPPVTANVSNTIGLVPGSLMGSIGYRRELAGQRSRLVRLGAATALGALLGAVLLLTLPSSTFETVVPVLIVLACALVLLQPWLAARMAERQRNPHGGAGVWTLVLGTGVYGGYFGAAQGVLLLGILGLGLDEPLQRVNAAKNVLATIANLVSGVFFVFFAHVDWYAALLIALGASVGGVVGARVGRRVQPGALRWLVVVIGVVAAVRLVVG